MEWSRAGFNQSGAISIVLKSKRLVRGGPLGEIDLPLNGAGVK